MFSPSPLTHVTPEVRGGVREADENTASLTSHMRCSHVSAKLTLLTCTRTQLSRPNTAREKPRDGRYPPLWRSLEVTPPSHYDLENMPLGVHTRHNTARAKGRRHLARAGKKPATDHIRRVLDLVVDATARHLHRQHTDWFGHRWCHRVVLPAPALLYESRIWVRHRK